MRGIREYSEKIEKVGVLGMCWGGKVCFLFPYFGRSWWTFESDTSTRRLVISINSLGRRLRSITSTVSCFAVGNPLVQKPSGFPFTH